MWETILMKTMLTWMLFSFMALPLLTLMAAFPNFVPVNRRPGR